MISIARVVNTLTKRKYVAVSRIKTGTIQGRDGTRTGKFIVHLTKTDEFETVYEEWEQERAARTANYEQKKAGSSSQQPEISSTTAANGGAALESIQEGEGKKEGSATKKQANAKVSSNSAEKATKTKSEGTPVKE